MGKTDTQYLEALSDIYHNGHERHYRNGIRVVGDPIVFKYDHEDGLPITGIKRTNVELALAELLWFITGSTKIKDFNQIQKSRGINPPIPIWDMWAYNGDIGPIYGHAWRNWGGTPGVPGSGIDQLRRVVDLLKGTEETTHARLLIYNPIYVAPEGMSVKESIKKGYGGITPCVSLLNFNTVSSYIHLTVTQSSGDMLLGVPFNLAQYGILLRLIAMATHKIPALHTHVITSPHIYENQMEDLEESGILDKAEIPNSEITVNPDIDLFDIKPEDIQVHYSTPNPHIYFALS